MEGGGERVRGAQGVDELQTSCLELKDRIRSIIYYTSELKLKDWIDSLEIPTRPACQSSVWRGSYQAITVLLCSRPRSEQQLSSSQESLIHLIKSGMTRTNTSLFPTNIKHYNAWRYLPSILSTLTGVWETFY